MLDYLQHVKPLEQKLGTTDNSLLATALNATPIALPTSRPKWRLDELTDELGTLTAASAVATIDAIANDVVAIPAATVSSIELKKGSEMSEADRAAFRGLVAKESAALAADEGLDLSRVGLNKFLRDAGLAHVADLAASLSTVPLEVLGRTASEGDVKASRDAYNAEQTKEANDAAFDVLWAKLENDHIAAAVADRDQTALASGLYAAALAAGFVE